MRSEEGADSPVDVALDYVTAEWGSGWGGQFEVDLGAGCEAGKRGAGDGFGGEVGREGVGVDVEGG